MSDWVYQLWITGREFGPISYNPANAAWRPYFLTVLDKWPWEETQCTALVKEGPKAIVPFKEEAP